MPYCIDNTKNRDDYNVGLFALDSCCIPRDLGTRRPQEFPESCKTLPG
jgi:hypothetical protein